MPSAVDLVNEDLIIQIKYVLVIFRVAAGVNQKESRKRIHMTEPTLYYIIIHITQCWDMLINIISGNKQ